MKKIDLIGSSAVVKRAVLVGTRNKDKLQELRALLEGFDVEVLSLVDFPRCRDVKETGKTFEANARRKAEFYARQTGLLTLADDSGLSVDALKGRPGVYSARFAGPGCSYRDNNRKLRRLLKGVPPGRRGAAFVCAIALYKAKRCVGVVKGECQGRIAFEERGKRGFGYDPLFIPKGFAKTFAELTPAEKNRVSHRGRALRQAVKIILKFFRT